MFQIKICGITNLADARHAVEAGADAVGLNFYSRTPRYVTPATAREIRQAMPKDVLCVGVFVNATAAEVATIADAVGLDALQFHGDESPHALAEYRKTAGRVATLPLRVGTPSGRRCHRGAPIKRHPEFAQHTGPGP